MGFGKSHIIGMGDRFNEEWLHNLCITAKREIEPPGYTQKYPSSMKCPTEFTRKHGLDGVTAVPILDEDGEIKIALVVTLTRQFLRNDVGIDPKAPDFCVTAERLPLEDLPALAKFFSELDRINGAGVGYFRGVYVPEGQGTIPFEDLKGNPRLVNDLSSGKLRPVADCFEDLSPSRDESILPFPKSISGNR